MRACRCVVLALLALIGCASAASRSRRDLCDLHGQGCEGRNMTTRAVPAASRPRSRWPSREQATGTVNFKNFDQHEAVTLDLVKFKDDWHTDDIRPRDRCARCSRSGEAPCGCDPPLRSSPHNKRE